LPMRESFTLDWDSPDDIELIKKFLKFHAKRLKCTEYEVLVKMARELDKGVLVEVATVERQIFPKKKGKVEEKVDSSL
jgi:hypothetical protein